MQQGGWLRCGGCHLPGPADTPTSGTQATLPLADVAARVLQELPLGVLVFDRDLRVVHHNEAAERLLGPLATAGAMSSIGTGRGSNLDWEAELRQVIESATATRRDLALRLTEPDSDRLLDVRCIPLTRDEGAEVIGAILAVEDITSRAGLERRLAVSERLAAVGKLAARVAHELNNPLDGILRYINLAVRRMDAAGDERVLDYLAESRKGLLRMAQILSELLEFSRSGHSQFEEANINATVEEAIRTQQNQADRAGVTIAAIFRTEQMPVLPGGMLFQVCCNLIKNAIDAMPDGGRLTITTGTTDREVVLRFEDTGTGLPEPIEQVFQPFFTTKGSGQGTGLGLAICKDYIERLRGKITAAQTKAHGAVFTVQIPLASCVPDRRRKPNP